MIGSAHHKTSGTHSLHMHARRHRKSKKPGSADLKFPVPLQTAFAEFAQDGAVRQNEFRNASWDRERAMDVLQDIVALIGHAIEAVLIYIETHHWIFGLLALGYIFYLHDRALHARFDALERRLDEIRKRLAVEY